MNFTGHTYIITGGNKIPGIGSQIALQLLDTGANVVINSRSDCTHWNTHENLLCISGDITDVKFQDFLITKTLEKFNGVSGLINNASSEGGSRGNLDQIGLFKRDSWIQCYKENVITPYELTQKLSGYLKLSGAGSVVNISSRAAIMEHVGDNLPYIISKNAMNKLTKRLAVEFQGFITVNSIAPTLTKTKRILDSLGSIDIERSIDPADVANVALMLLSNRAITGQVIPICKGYSL